MLLASSSKIEQNKGLKIVKDLSTSEQKEILKSMVDKMNANDILDNDILKTIVAMANDSKAIHQDIVVHLKSIPLDKYARVNLTQIGLLSLKLSEPLKQELCDYVKTDTRKWKIVEDFLKTLR